MKISIRWAIIIGCIVLIWGTLLIITPFSYFSTKKVMLLHTKDIMENISDLTVKETQNFFSLARGAAHLTQCLISSEIVDIEKEQIEKLEKYFSDQLEIYSQFAGIYFANPEGEFYYVSRNAEHTPGGYRTKFIEITPQGRQVKLIWRDKDMKIIQEKLDPKDSYDPRKRPWYKKAIKGRQVVWTNPYMFFTSQKPGITAAEPIYDANDKFLGIVGVDIELDVLSNFIGSLRVGKTGIAFMIDKDSNVIAYPDSAQLKYSDGKENTKIRLPKLWELSNPVCKLAYDSIEQTNNSDDPQIIKNSIFAAFKAGGEKYYTMFTPVQESKISWMIGVYIPEKDYFGKIITNQRINLLLTLILSCIATVAGLILARKIIRPIFELDKEAQDITKQNYTPQPKIKTVFTEIQRTADTFHEMKTAVITYKKELKKKEQIHRTITDTANEAILMINEDKKVSYWNSAAETIFGYKNAEIIGKNLYDIVPFQKNNKNTDLSLNTIFNNASKEQFQKNIALDILNKDGHKFYVEVSIVHIKIDQQYHAIAVIHDISQRKKLENDKIAALKQLQQAQKMEALGLLAGGVAHDLNNVLSGIVSYPELLLMDLPKDSPLRGAILTIQDSGKRAASIVEDLLTLARRGVPNIEIINFNDIINGYLKSPEYKALIRCHQNISIHTSLATDLLNITGVFMHLNKTVMNLVSNAAEAIQNDGSIMVSTRNIYIDGPVKGYEEICAGDFILLTVQDTGTGISSDDLKRIFEPFYTNKIMGRSGTGLGMSVVWGTVQDHKGYIDIESSPDKGTKFQLYFPATRKHIAAKKELVSVEDYTGKGESVLVIDDVKEQREIAIDLLSRLKYAVTTVSSGEQAIEYMKNNRSDLLILDMIMGPGIDGLDTYKQILKLYPKQKAIIASGFSDNDRVKEAQRLGAGEYIKKPYTFERIGLAVKKELTK
ncbi:MAG: PAS domain S-box protein [Desulfobacteraceae bacterium]|nr:PAS domain S-box protein [Desulfobacteraceae bacterium]